MTLWKVSERRDSAVIAYNHHKELALLCTDVTGTITSWLDENGDDCRKEDAAVFIAGHDDAGWVGEDIRQFSRSPN